jgi:hypothetical protein
MNPAAEPLAVEWAAQHATILVLPDEAAALALAEKDAAGVDAKLRDANGRAAELPEVIEAKRLANLIASVHKDKVQAEASQKVAAGKARQLLERGEDPTQAETTAANEAARAQTLTARITHLERLHKDAEGAAERKGRELVAGARSALFGDLAKQRADLLARLHEAMAPALTELLAVDLVLRSLRSH